MKLIGLVFTLMAGRSFCFNKKEDAIVFVLFAILVKLEEIK